MTLGRARTRASPSAVQTEFSVSLWLKRKRKKLRDYSGMRIKRLLRYAREVSKEEHIIKGENYRDQGVKSLCALPLHQPKLHVFLDMQVPRLLPLRVPYQ